MPTTPLIEDQLKEQCGNDVYFSLQRGAMGAAILLDSTRQRVDDSLILAIPVRGIRSCEGKAMREGTTFGEGYVRSKEKVHKSAVKDLQYIREIYQLQFRTHEYTFE